MDQDRCLLSELTVLLGKLDIPDQWCTHNRSNSAKAQRRGLCDPALHCLALGIHGTTHSEVIEVSVLAHFNLKACEQLTFARLELNPLVPPPLG